MQRRRGRKLSSFFSDKERREYERKKDRKEYRLDDRKEEIERSRRATRGGARGQAPQSLIKEGHASPLRRLAPPVGGQEVHPVLQLSES